MARLSGLVVADPAQAPPGSRIELEVATIVPENVDLGSRAGADAGIVRTGAGTTAVADDGSPRLRRRPARPRRPGRRVARGPHRSRDERRLAAAEARGRRRRPARARLPGLRALSGDRRAARREPRRPAARPAAGTRRRAQRLLSARARLRPPGAGEGRDALPRLEDGAANGRVHESSTRRPTAQLHPETFCPSGFWGLSKVIERRVVGDWQLAPSRRARGLRDRRSPRSDHRARHARASARGALRRQHQGRRGEEGRHRERPEGARPDRQGDHLRGRRGKSGSTASRSVRRCSCSSRTRRRSSRRRRSRSATARRASASSSSRRSCARRRMTRRSSSCSAARPPSPTSCRASSPASRISARRSSSAPLPPCSASAPRRLRGPSPRRSPRRRSGKKPIAAGDLITSLRRKLLAKGELTALCLTAFGDAGWQLGGKDA